MSVGTPNPTTGPTACSSARLSLPPSPRRPSCVWPGSTGSYCFTWCSFTEIIWLGYRFLAAQSPQGLALGYTVAFFAASITPLYAIWLTSEAFLVACVFVAYFLWFYKEVAPRPEGRLGGFLFGSGSDLVAAVVLGLAVFAKPVPS